MVQQQAYLPVPIEVVHMVARLADNFCIVSTVAATAGHAARVAVVKCDTAYLLSTSLCAAIKASCFTSKCPYDLHHHRVPYGTGAHDTQRVAVSIMQLGALPPLLLA